MKAKQEQILDFLISFSFDEKLSQPIFYKAWLKDEGKQMLSSQVKSFGAVLIRGLPILTPSQLGDLVEEIGIKKTSYVGGNNPRVALERDIYLSTTYPPNWKITLHNEMSHLPNPPDVIVLYCKKPVQSGAGGATPLAEAAKVYEEMEKEIKEKMNAKGLSYLQRLHSKDQQNYSFGRPWEEVFCTSDRGRVEEICLRLGARFHWSDSRLSLEFRGPTFRQDFSGKKVWFNQAEQWHWSNIQSEVRAFLEKKIGKESFPHHSCFATGEEYDIEMLESIRRVYARQERRFNWQTGDVLIVNNHSLMHGRDTYEGNREVYFMMGNWI